MKKCYDREEYISSQKPREKMGGVNLQDGLMEVALEQWIERCHNYDKTVSRFQRSSSVMGSGIGCRGHSVLTESRDDISEFRW